MRAPGGLSILPSETHAGTDGAKHRGLEARASPGEVKCLVPDCQARGLHPLPGV
jgi:hypothetical protein